MSHAQDTAKADPINVATLTPAAVSAVLRALASLHSAGEYGGDEIDAHLAHEGLDLYAAEIVGAALDRDDSWETREPLANFCYAQLELMRGVGRRLQFSLELDASLMRAVADRLEACSAFAHEGDADMAAEVASNVLDRIHAAAGLDFEVHANHALALARVQTVTELECCGRADLRRLGIRNAWSWGMATLVQLIVKHRGLAPARAFVAALGRELAQSQRTSAAA